MILANMMLFLFCITTKVSNYESFLDPAGTSVKNLVHYAQASLSGKFQMYDYGSKEENIMHYNESKAPMYTLDNINVPVALYSARNDWLADQIDVEYLRSGLKSKIVDDYELPDWNHLDFTLAVDAKIELYDRIIKLMENF